MPYFNRFPMMVYDVKGDKNYKLLPDILRRVKLRSGLRSGSFMFDNYDVKDGERPEDVAFKWFGDAQLHWVILMTNNVTDRFYQWPLTQPELQAHLEDKYGAGSEDDVHHYEIPQSSGPTSSRDNSHMVECNADEDNVSIISNRQYEERKQDEYRQIRLLDPQFLETFIEEFESLIRG